MKSNGQSSGFGGQPWGWRDAAWCAGLAALAVFFLNASWRKWPDPLVDFGREVYLPWRITQGAVLYRDMNHVYGPFSSYFNSLVFRVGGVGMTSLITSNLVIYAAILGLLYGLVRAGWGRGVALVSGTVFVGVFSFSHLLGTGNYNYATPYAHETTHGMLVVLLLILTLRSCLERSARWKLGLAGLLAGLTLLIKPEVMLAAGMVTFGAAGLLYHRHGRGLFTAEWGGRAWWFLLGCALPVATATILFRFGAGFSWEDAAGFANYAWIGVLGHANIQAEPLQKSILGTEQLATNLISEAFAGLMVLAIGFGLALGCRYLCGKDRLASHSSRPWDRESDEGGDMPLVENQRCGRLRTGAAGLRGKLAQWGVVLFTGAVGVVMVIWIPWLDAAAALPGLLVFAAISEWRRMRGEDGGAKLDRAMVTRVFLWLAAVSLLARMAFNPRIEHYGFFQASLAAIVGIAALLDAVPEVLRLEQAARRFYQVMMAALILAGGGMIARQSLQYLSLRTQPVGQGKDLFFSFDRRIDPTGALVETLRDYFATKDPGARSLMMLPDGVMLNYLTRLPSTVPQYMFFPALLEGGREQITLELLKASPPDRVVLISRDLREVGAERFGDAVGHGKLLLDFVERNYDRVVTLGGNPLDVNQHGAWVYALKSMAPQPR